MEYEYTRCTGQFLICGVDVLLIQSEPDSRARESEKADCSGIACSGVAVWRDGEGICALADRERHLGHVVRTEDWHAFDGTHLNNAGDGFRYLGAYQTADQAKSAVERAASPGGDATPVFGRQTPRSQAARGQLR